MKSNPMPTQPAFVITYQQTIGVESNSPEWSEAKEISVKITSSALTSGWLKQFATHPIDLLILHTIGLHVRPLDDDDIRRLQPYGLVTLADKGRLFTYITDVGIADELGIHRTTVSDSAKRLQQAGNLIIREMSAAEKKAQAAQGRFAGSRIYILSGKCQITKDIQPKNHRVGLTDTVPLEVLPTVSVKPTPPVGATDINVVDVVVGGETEKVVNLFCQLKGGGYEFSPKDREHLSQLFAAGYTQEQILQGITIAFELTSKPKQFVQCARVTRQRFSPSGTPENGTPALRNANIQNAVTENESAITQHPELAGAIEKYRRLVKRELDVDDVTRLKHLATLCDESACKAGETGPVWLGEALDIAFTADAPVESPLSYVKGILRNWMEHGKGSDVRPTREGYRPQRKASKPESSADDAPRGKYLNLGGY